MSRMPTAETLAAARCAALAAGRIDVWTWRLRAARGELALLFQLLSADERARVARLAFVQDRVQFIVGRARMRQVLAGYLAVPPEALRFGYGDRGKPMLSHCASAPFFNLSHSGDFAALAVAHCGDVGIDVEQIRPVGSEIAQRFFTEGEKAILARLSGSEWRQAFYRCWTRKEAVLKANGKGLSGGLASFDVALATDATARPLRLQRDRSDSAEPWSVQDLALAAGFVGAVAVRAGRAQGALRHFRLGSTARARRAMDPLAPERLDIGAQGYGAARGTVSAL